MTKLVAVAAAALLWLAGDAHAQMRDLVSTVVSRHKNAGADVVTLPTRFVYDGESFSIVLPMPATAKRCTSVELIGARGLSFHVTTGDEADAGKAPSAAGALEIVSCDSAPLEKLRVQSDAGRGALEFVVSFSDAPLPSLRDVLPERAPGASASSAEAGPLPALGPAVKRAEAAELRARRDGAAMVTRSVLTASKDGSGSARVDVEPGCHRFDLSASEARKRARVDLDAEIANVKDDALLARDRGDAADARLDLCVGTAMTLRLAFVGASPDEPILIAHSVWPLPASFGLDWNADTRARMLGAFVAHRMPPPVDRPAFVALGGGGLTAVSAGIEPGSCYVAVAGLSHGVVRAMRLRATVGQNEASEERPAQEGAGLVTFCARDRDVAQFEVDARGTSVAWTLALFRVANGVWELP